MVDPYVPGNFLYRHLYIQWGGKLPGNEQWSCGVRMVDPTLERSAIQMIDDAAAKLDDIAGVMVGFHASADTHVSSLAKLSFTKINAINETGTYYSDETNEYLHSDVAGAGTNLYPNQVSLALSLTTGYTRGAAHRGRFYLPLPDIAVGTDGLIPDADRDEVVSSGLTLRTSLNAVFSGGQYVLGVCSRKDGGPAQRTVTGCQVGRVLDTQRRRRNKLIEAYA